MRRFRFLVVALLSACSKSAMAPIPSPAPPPPMDPYVVGLVTDSLTPSSRLYQAPWWAFYIIVVGADANHSGIAFQGTVGRAEVGRFAHCIGTAGQLPGERQLAYLALGDTMYSADSIAFSALENLLAQGADSLRSLADSAVLGLLHTRLPGLVAIWTGLFNPTISIYGRGATASTAILRRWGWTDGTRTFAEESSHVALNACGLN